MDLYLVRHGDTALGPDGLYPDPAHLSETGHAQARALALRLGRIAPPAPIPRRAFPAAGTAARSAPPPGDPGLRGRPVGGLL